MSWHRLKALLIKEFIQITRDKMTMLIMAVLPIVQLLIFGFAINTDIKHLPTVVFDQSLSQDSRNLIDSFSATSYYDIKFVAHSFQEVNSKIESGEALVGIIIPPDLSEVLKHERSVEIQVIVDASDNTSANSAISTAQLVGQVKSQEIITKKIQAISGKKTAMAYDIRIRPWYNPDFVSSFYMVPGILGTMLTMVLVMLTAMALVRERELGTLEQLLVTPIKPYELIIGKIIPYILVGYIQLSLALAAAILVFDIPTAGSIALLYVLAAFFIIASLAQGIFISTIAQNQMQAMQLSFFILMPTILLSGFVFPRASMPQIFYYLGNLLPLTYFLQITRGILLKGIGMEHLWQPVACLALYIVVFISISVARLKKTLM